eukprot:10984442-Heterocapsa_arctica.AAC.1
MGDSEHDKSGMEIGTMCVDWLKHMDHFEHPHGGLHLLILNCKPSIDRRLNIMLKFCRCSLAANGCDLFLLGLVLVNYGRSLFAPPCTTGAA